MDSRAPAARSRFALTIYLFETSWVQNSPFSFSEKAKKTKWVSRGYRFSLGVAAEAVPASICRNGWKGFSREEKRSTEVVSDLILVAFCGFSAVAAAVAVGMAGK